MRERRRADSVDGSNVVADALQGSKAEYGWMLGNY